MCHGTVQISIVLLISLVSDDDGVAITHQYKIDTHCALSQEQIEELTSVLLWWRCQVRVTAKMQKSPPGLRRMHRDRCMPFLQVRLVIDTAG